MKFFDLDKLFGDKTEVEGVWMSWDTLFKTLELCMHEDFEADMEFEYQKETYPMGTKIFSQKKIALYLGEEDFQDFNAFKDSLKKYGFGTIPYISIKSAQKYVQPFYG